MPNTEQTPPPAGPVPGQAPEDGPPVLSAVEVAIATAWDPVEIARVLLGGPTAARQADQETHRWQQSRACSTPRALTYRPVPGPLPGIPHRHVLLTRQHSGIAAHDHDHCNGITPTAFLTWTALAEHGTGLDPTTRTHLTTTPTTTGVRHLRRVLTTPTRPTRPVMTQPTLWEHPGQLGLWSWDEPEGWQTRDPYPGWTGVPA